MPVSAPQAAPPSPLLFPVAKQHELMTLDGFMMYLLSPEGAALNVAHTCVFQDMDQPLAHYFISSSHNTYLTDHQVRGSSSTEAYIRYSGGGEVRGFYSGGFQAKPAHCPTPCHTHSLPFNRRAFAQGCRCVELDCWEGPEGEPVIYHGHTLTSKILFRDVIQTVRDHAFKVSSCDLMPGPRAFLVTPHTSQSQTPSQSTHSPSAAGNERQIK